MTNDKWKMENGKWKILTLPARSSYLRDAASDRLPSAFWFLAYPLQSTARLKLPHFKVRVSDHEPRGKEPARYSLEQPSNRAWNREYH
jgi:hypothetical protein